ncbi:MAG: hypothetical protein GX116_05040 [Fibrobacter sp.]|jgi:ATP-dependent DNA ligase|nr:hypothetical protein [Fibrobacter sp.]
MQDKLELLFKMQSDLNDFVFQKKEIKDSSGAILNTESLFKMGQIDTPKGPNSETNQWLSKYLEALNDESRELKEELLWKWWSKDSLNMQNIRVEIVDQLHFWISLALTAGMDADKVFDIYCQKNKLNIERQNKEYSKANKDEKDNQEIA